MISEDAEKDISSEQLEDHTEKIKQEYESHLLMSDPNSPEAAHWKGKDKTWLRFKILTEIDNLNNKKVLDFGCGNALLMDFLNERGIKCEYHGWDISERMIEVAKKRHPKAKFKVINIFHEDLSEYVNFFDYILISGVFYIKVDGEESVHKKWIEQILLKLWNLSKKGLAVNFMTEYVDWRDSSLYYCPINEIIIFCVDNLSRWFVIRHDYQLWEFTVYIYKEPKVKL